MRFMRLLIVAVILLGWAVPGLSFDSPQGGFSIHFPGQPKLSVSQDQTSAGAITEYTYTDSTKSLQLTANYQDVPGIADFFANHALEDAKKGLLQDMNATLLKARMVQLGDFPGLQIAFDAAATETFPAAYGEAHFYLVRKRLYVLVALAPKDKPDMQNIGNFLDSFRL